jgi:hypothetical protein
MQGGWVRTRKLKFGDLDYLTEVDIEILATIFACATAMIGLDMFKGDKMRAQALMDRFDRSAGVALLLEEPEL